MLNKNNKFYLIITINVFIVITFYSCSITNSQFKTTKQYFLSLKDIDKKCNNVYSLNTKIIYDRKILYPKTFSNDSIMINELIEALSVRNENALSNDSFKISVNKIKNYINSFDQFLSKPSESKQSNRRVLNAFEDYSSYLPFGIGLTIYKTIYDISNYSIRLVKIPHQRNKIKKYIKNGNNYFPSNCLITITELNKISSSLDTEKILLKNNYLKFLSEQKINRSPFDYYNNYNNIFLKQYNTIVLTQKLSDALIVLLSSSQKSFKTLFNNIQKRNKLNSDSLNLQEINLQMDNLSKINAELKNNN